MELEAVTRDIQCMIQKVRSLYKDGHTAYWLPPLVLMGKKGPIGRIKQGDSVIFCCRRGEREIQLTRSFTDQHFKGFSRNRLHPLTFVPFTLYHPDLRYLPVAFAPRGIQETLGEALSHRDLAQFHIAEQEKYAHVTYFFNGGMSDPFPGEVDQIVPSFPDEPLRAPSILVETLRKAISQSTFPFVILNIASGDLVGHYTDLDPKIACAETVDHALGEILEIAHQHDHWVAVTADHGVLEEHGLPGSAPNTSHTTHPVPFVLVSPSGEKSKLKRKGILADVAPTLLSMMGIPKPEPMTGRQLICGEVPRVKRVMLVILDGWGLGSKGHINPIQLARTPHWDDLLRLSMARLEASGDAVGLLPNLKGNSEAGHMNLGAGRVVVQDDVRIQHALESGTFMDNPAFHRAINDAKMRKGFLHLLGILSQTSSHGSMDYVIELLRLAKEKNFSDVFVHLITDGRSSRSEHVPMLLDELRKEMEQIGTGRIVSLVGRGFALDRGGDYEHKTRLVYNALVAGDALPVPGWQ
jgi:2,3-bisphosphoglycerate-independent phosphoglycerate mutase